MRLINYFHCWRNYVNSGCACIYSVSIVECLLPETECATTSPVDFVDADGDGESLLHGVFDEPLDVERDSLGGIDDDDDAVRNTVRSRHLVREVHVTCRGAEKKDIGEKRSRRRRRRMN